MLTEGEYSKRLVKIWIFGFVGLSILIGSVNCARYFKLSRHGVPTEVTVKEIETSGLRSVHYTYSVDRIAYEGEGHAGFGNPRLELVKIGDKLKGYYDQSDPSLSGLGEPLPQLIRESIFALIMAFIAPTVLVWRAKRRYRKWLQENQTPVQG